MSEHLTRENSSVLASDPVMLLQRYESEVYPPAFNQDERQVMKIYLDNLGLEPRIGVISFEENPTIKGLVQLAMAGLHLPKGVSEDDIIVGPHSLDKPRALSLWTPKPHLK